jgi:hypothetical protein
MQNETKRLSRTCFVGGFAVAVLCLWGAPAKAISVDESFSDTASIPILSYPATSDFPKYFGLNSSLSQSPPAGWLDIFKNALDPWDYWLCFGDDLIYDPNTLSRTTVQWQSNAYFNGQIFAPPAGGGMYLGAYVPDGATTPGNVPTNEIYFNSDVPWHFGPGPVPDGKIDFYSVALHEIGHALGLVGDWGQKENPPPGKTPDEIMWGVFQYGKTYKGLQPSDLKEFSGIYPDRYAVHVPSPLPIVGAMTAFSFARNLRRRLRR